MLLVSLALTMCQCHQVMLQYSKLLCVILLAILFKGTPMSMVIYIIYILNLELRINAARCLRPSFQHVL